jgi:hypothetical protein
MISGAVPRAAQAAPRPTGSSECCPEEPVQTYKTI